MRVLIVGASGGTGRALLAQALARGHEVTALVRDTAKLALRHEHLRVVQGDVLDPVSVDAAVAGQEAVLSALGHKRFMIPTRILSDGTRNLLQAMERHGVRRYIGMSALGVGDSWWRMGLYYTLFVTPVILQFYFWDKRRQERLIRSSELDWTIVRPGALTNGRPRGAWRTGPTIGNPIWTVRIARADVAHFVLDQLASTKHLRQTVAIAW
ncbi:MAG: SDR family oxidoreductase [Thermoanaerobaculia bacterium]|jgi:putative NADH-flavin reductase|nr:SDR family oxidoreductase [Thermoanaerobaculia bacterium]MBP9823394.1 SDR family oxidoreductase [Thermoanaerobaculia bacterium]